MLHSVEFRAWGTANALRRGIGSQEFRMHSLERLQFLEQRIVGRVGNARPVEDVVLVIVLVQLAPQFCGALYSLCGRAHALRRAQSSTSASMARSDASVKGWRLLSNSSPLRLLESSLAVLSKSRTASTGEAGPGSTMNMVRPGVEKLSASAGSSWPGLSRPATENTGWPRSMR